jgi:Fe-S-cluster-containing hydrogenase component 2
MACAFSHPVRAGQPGQSAIRAFAIAPPDRGIPIVCLQCDSAACVTVCPSGALERRATTGAIAVNKERCIKCHACVAVCPFGNIAVEETSGYVVKCDLCNGQPRCVQFCPTETLTYR